MKYSPRFRICPNLHAFENIPNIHSRFDRIHVVKNGEIVR